MKNENKFKCKTRRTKFIFYDETAVKTKEQIIELCCNTLHQLGSIKWR